VTASAAERLPLKDYRRQKKAQEQERIAIQERLERQLKREAAASAANSVASKSVRARPDPVADEKVLCRKPCVHRRHTVPILNVCFVGLCVADC
jgi:hypothetical protein